MKTTRSRGNKNEDILKKIKMKKQYLPSPKTRLNYASYIPLKPVFEN